MENELKSELITEGWVKSVKVPSPLVFVGAKLAYNVSSAYAVKKATRIEL